MCFLRSDRAPAKAAKAVCLVAVLMLLLLCVLRIRGRTLERSAYSSQFGEISVKEVEVTPLSFRGLLGLGSKLYRCEFRRSPRGALESAVSLGEDSYTAQQVEVVWHSARNATVSFDRAIFYKLEDGVWKKGSKGSDESETPR